MFYVQLYGNCCNIYNYLSKFYCIFYFVVWNICCFIKIIIFLRVRVCSCSKTDEKQFICDKTRHIFNKKLEDNVRKYASNFVWRNRYEKVNFRPRMQLAISNAQAQRPLKMTHIIGQSNIWLLILTKKWRIISWKVQGFNWLSSLP